MGWLRIDRSLSLYGIRLMRSSCRICHLPDCDSELNSSPVLLAQWPDYDAWPALVSRPGGGAVVWWWDDLVGQQLVFC